MKEGQVYTEENLKEIRFPLGGIGSGCINIAGNGRIQNWEIFNRPNVKSENIVENISIAQNNTHFSIKVEDGKKVLDARVLHGDSPKPYSGGLFNCLSRSSMEGFPHFRQTRFTGTYPLGNIDFMDENFPGKVNMDIFNPLIPLNDEDSSIPAGFFKMNITNDQDRPLTYTVCSYITNSNHESVARNRFIQEGEIKSLNLYSDSEDKDSPEYGEVSVSTDCEEFSYQEYVFRGHPFHSFEKYWHELNQVGKLKKRSYNTKNKIRHNDGLLCAHVEVQPKETVSVKFVISWYYPNFYHYWEQKKQGEAIDKKDEFGIDSVWKNYYATIFEDSLHVGRYSLQNFDILLNSTRNFVHTIIYSSMPDAAKDAVLSNLANLKSPSSLRYEDGSYWAFEGHFDDEGCCAGTCNHVYNYAYALAFLFPKMERRLREIDYKYNIDENGNMSFRTLLPIGRGRWDYRACVDGQYGGVLKTYRDWKLFGDNEWLKRIWPEIKKSIEFAWSEHNEDKWDRNKDGVLEGRQHHTLDVELIGPNSWLTGIYLGALKAAGEMADALGEEDVAKEYNDIFIKGKEFVDENLFNGEYYYQNIELNDPEQLKGLDAYPGFWDDENNEVIHQIGEGCIVDQVLAQWHANLSGLGEIFDKKQRTKALGSIYKYNYKETLRDYVNPCRLYAVNDEASLVICSWPDEKKKPLLPILYSQESMNGFEYQAGIHMIQEGLIEEGERVIKSIRDRYDGIKRDPYNEYEAGSHYGRSLASFALVPTYSGFKFDMTKKHIGFDPIFKDGEYSNFWSVDSAWGEIKIVEGEITLKVIKGELKLKSIQLPFIKSITDIEFGHEYKDGTIIFEDEISLVSKRALKIKAEF